MATLSVRSCVSANVPRFPKSHLTPYLSVAAGERADPLLYLCVTSYLKSKAKQNKTEHFEEGFIWALGFRGYSIVAGMAQGQERGAAGQVVSTGSGQMNGPAQLTLSFLFCPGPQSM